MTPGQFVNAVLAANAAAREQQVLLGNSDTAIYMQAPPPDVENMNDAIEPDETWNFIQDVIISGGLDFGAPIVKSLFTDAALTSVTSTATQEAFVKSVEAWAIQSIPVFSTPPSGEAPPEEGPSDGGVPLPGGQEIGSGASDGAAGPGQIGGSGKVAGPPTGTGNPDGPAGPGQTGGGGGRIAEPPSATGAPDGPAAPGQTSGGGGRVSGPPGFTGTPDGPIGPGGGGGGGGLFTGGGSNKPPGEVKAE